MRAFDILYEDEELFVVDKPSGLLTVPSPQEPDKTLIRYVNEAFVHQTGQRLYPCHRLDRDTSGAVIFAKSKKSQQLMRLLFERKAVTKKYIAFIRGRLKAQTGQINLPISDFHQRRFSRLKIRSKSALTQYKVIQATVDFSVVEVRPITGRTNQIRIHFNAIGQPLLGERLYAFGKDFPVKFRRLALHAHELQFRHLVSGQMVRIISPLAKDMEKFLKEH